MTVTINGTTGVTTPDVTSDSYTGPISVNASAPDNSVVVNAAGNLGLGVTPSAWGGVYGSGGVLDFKGNVAVAGFNQSINVSTNSFWNGSNWIYKASTGSAQYQIAGNAHQWFTAPSGTAGNVISFTQAMTLSQSSGSTTLEVAANNAINNFASLRLNSVYYNTWDLINDGTLRFVRGGSEFMRIDSSGNLLVGTTSGSSARVRIKQASDVGSALDVDVASSAYYLTRYSVNSSVVGSVTTSGTTVSFNTSSDYRLKEDIQPMTGALEKVAALKPCTYKWKSDGSDGEGFIAHELAEVVPQCVTGEKDAVDSDGNPVYQGIDTSFLVATLTAAIQEQQALIDSLTTRIAALEAK